MESPVDSAIQVEKVSLWRATREIFRDSRSTLKYVLNECPASWRTIRSGMSWCCLLLIINGAFWLFGGLLFASLEGMFMFINLLSLTTTKCYPGYDFSTTARWHDKLLSAINVNVNKEKIYVFYVVPFKAGTKVAISVEPCASVVTSLKNYGNSLQYYPKTNGESWPVNGWLILKTSFMKLSALVSLLTQEKELGVFGMPSHLAWRQYLQLVNQMFVQLKVMWW